MSRHRFKLGQSVVAHGPGIPPGPYMIVRLLPLVGKEAHYQGKSSDGVVRALLESQIRPAPEGLWLEASVLPKKSQRGR